MTNTWKLLVLWSGAVTAFGAVLMGGAFAPTDGPARWLLALLGGAAPAMDPPLRFALGLMSAVTFGLGLTVLALASVSARLEAALARTLWRRVAWALGAWYVVDGAISVATGFGLNVVSNTLLMVAFLGILWRGGVSGRTSRAQGPMAALA